MDLGKFQKKYYLLFIFTIVSIKMLAQEEKDFLFIGDSFFSQNNLVAKFEKNYLQIYDESPLTDSSLVNGTNCIRQVQKNADLRNKLKGNDYKYVILQSPSLLEPDTYQELAKTIKEIYLLSPQTENVLLVSFSECSYFPRYECKKVRGKVSCSVYKNCAEQQDTIRKITERLVENLKGVNILPFSDLKNDLRSINFKKKDDIYGHPSKEMQELLSRCIVLFLQTENSENIVENPQKQTTLYNGFLSLSEEEMSFAIKRFIQLLNTNYD